MQPFVLGVLAHVLDDISTDIVDFIYGVYLDEASSPNLLQFFLLDEWQVANHVVVNRSTLLELDYGHILQLGISVPQTLDELFEVLVASLDVTDIEIDLAESQCKKLATPVKIHADELTNTVSPVSLTCSIILLRILAFFVTFIFSFSTAGGVQPFVSPNLDNPLCGNDFLIVTIQQNHPLSEGANRPVFRLIRIV